MRPSVNTADGHILKSQPINYLCSISHQLQGTSPHVLGIYTRPVASVSTVHN